MLKRGEVVSTLKRFWTTLRHSRRKRKNFICWMITSLFLSGSRDTLLLPSLTPRFSCICIWESWRNDLAADGIYNDAVEVAKVARFHAHEVSIVTTLQYMFYNGMWLFRFVVGFWNWISCTPFLVNTYILKYGACFATSSVSVCTHPTYKWPLEL